MVKTTGLLKIRRTCRFLIYYQRNSDILSNIFTKIKSFFDFLKNNLKNDKN